MASFVDTVSARYLHATRKGAFVKVMVAFARVGVGLGVFAMVICMALMNGFHEEIQNTLFSASAHFSVTGLVGDVPNSTVVATQIRTLPGVAGASPMRMEKGLLKGRITSSPPEGVMVKAIDPASAASTSSIYQSLAPFRVDQLKDGDILVGRELASRLGLRLDDSVTVAFLRAELGLSGLQPKFAAFRIAGFFESHISEYDRGWVFITLADGNRIAKSEDAEMIEVRATRLDQIDAVKQQVMASLGPSFLSTDLRETNKQLFAALKVEKWIFTALLSLIVLVAAFNIVASLVLLITEKRRDLGTLLALGATPRQVADLFERMGLRIALKGTLWGLGLSVPLCLIADQFRIIKLPASVYDFITYVPFRLSVLDILIAGGFPLFIGWLASRFPARRAAGVDPVDALRAE